jgi:hypothetical protein
MRSNGSWVMKRRVFIYTGYIVSNDTMILDDELERMYPVLIYSPSICLQGL